MFTLKFRKSPARNENRAPTSALETARQLRDDIIVQTTYSMPLNAQRMIIESYERRAQGR